MELDKRAQGRRVLVASCAAIFWPGGFIFSFPGLLGPHWQQTFLVGRGAVGQTLFFVLAAVGLFMFLAGPLGPWLSGLVLDATGGNFGMVFGYLGSFYVVSAIAIWFTRPPGKVSLSTDDEQG